ncbi:MAG: flavin reductase [Anaerolineae bacterium]|nr:flavin reductase [Anaerolineae bacterium]
MNRKSVDLKQFDISTLNAWNHWFLLTAGDFSSAKYNSMTISWGAFGVMWERPFAQVVVRPSRYTYQFIDTYPDFTLSAFPAGYEEALSLMGAVSGRDRDKIKESGLTPVKLAEVGAPAFAEAELIIKCRKVYYQDLNPDHFLADYVKESYPAGDIHRVYYGEIVGIEAPEPFYRPLD